MSTPVDRSVFAIAVKLRIIYSILWGTPKLADDISKTIISFANEQYLNSVAKDTGFIIRSRKITPQKFIDLMFYAVSQDFKSLRNISVEARQEHSIGISKQGLDYHFSPASVAFTKRILEQAISNQYKEDFNARTADLFKRILIKDSTRFDIDKSHKEQFPSYGGKTSQAGIGIQFEFDLKNNNITDLSIKASLDRDSKDAMDKLGLIEKGDLIIRDLGYYHSGVLEYIIDKKAYFITKLHSSTKVYSNKCKNKCIDFSKLYKQMNSAGVNQMDMNVYIGKKKRLPVRLVIDLLPEEVCQKRLLNKNKENKVRGYTTTKEYKDRARFNLFLCNIPTESLTTYQVSRFYKIRWQIELIFKTWKSSIRLDKMRKIKYARLLTTIHIKLLWIIIQWNIIQPIKNHAYRNEGKMLSILKCVDTLQEQTKKIRKALINKKDMLKETIIYIISIIAQNHWLEKRKNRMCLMDLLGLLL